LRLSLADSPIRLRHDPQRIGQVVTNLVGNAIKFTEPGGIVSIRAERTADDGATIEVSDTGVGIEPSELPRIFERFYRGTLANEARGSGSGLGLAIVRSIVDMHRGTVEVVSRLGIGTTFTVTLPADPRRDEDTAGAGIGSESAPDRGPGPAEPPAPDTVTPAPKMADSSPARPPSLNRESSG
jgi:signal transduction histidine kinase